MIAVIYVKTDDFQCKISHFIANGNGLSILFLEFDLKIHAIQYGHLHNLRFLYLRMKPIPINSFLPYSFAA